MYVVLLLSFPITTLWHITISPILDMRKTRYRDDNLPKVRLIEA